MQTNADYIPNCDRDEELHIQWVREEISVPEFNRSQREHLQSCPHVICQARWKCWLDEEALMTC